MHDCKRPLRDRHLTTFLLERNDAELLINLCESTNSKELWDVAKYMREQWGMDVRNLENVR